MKYIKLQESLLTGLSNVFDIEELYLELDEYGCVHREVGIDIDGRIIHAYPCINYKYGKYGIFDGVILNSIDANSSEEVFLSLWVKV